MIQNAIVSHHQDPGFPFLTSFHVTISQDTHGAVNCPQREKLRRAESGRSSAEVGGADGVQ